MNRYYVEMYSKNKFLANGDYENMEDCALLLDGDIDRIIIRDTRLNREYIVRKGKA